MHNPINLKCYPYGDTIIIFVLYKILLYTILFNYGHLWFIISNFLALKKITILLNMQVDFFFHLLHCGALAYKDILVHSAISHPIEKGVSILHHKNKAWKIPFFYFF